MKKTVFFNQVNTEVKYFPTDKFFFISLEYGLLPAPGVVVIYLVIVTSLLIWCKCAVSTKTSPFATKVNTNARSNTPGFIPPSIFAFHMF